MVSDKAIPVICKLMDYKKKMYDLFRTRMQETDLGERIEAKGIRSLNVQITDRITINDMKIKVQKNMQLAVKRKFHHLTLQMFSTVEN